MTDLNDNRLARLRDRELTDLLQDLDESLGHVRGRVVRPLFKRSYDVLWRLRDQLREGK